MNDLIAKVSIDISAPVDKVWEALTTPSIIKKYLFDTNVETDWKKGSKITYKGTWDGKEYEDKGIIVDIIPNEILKTTYWTSFSGLEDIPENYQNVDYELTPNSSGTTLTITQSNIKSKESVDQSEQNWQMVIDNMKKVIEES